MFTFLILAVISFFRSQEFETPEAPESLRALLDQRHSFRANGGTGPFHLQLEAKAYYSDGIVIENEDIIISGV